MKIILYKNSSEQNVANKNLEQIAELNGSLKQGCSITDPVIVVKNIFNFNFNYFTIPEFGRGYFLTDVSTGNGTFEISGHVDVLSSNITELVQNFAYIARTNKGNLYYRDPEIHVSEDSQIYRIQFPDEPFGYSKFVMLMTGNRITPA